MNESDALDDNLLSNELSTGMKSLGAKIGQWAKIIAIISIISQILDLAISALSNGFGSSLIFTAIIIGLYTTLLKFGHAMTRLSEVGSKKNFEDAMFKQKTFWQFLGVFMIIALAYLLIAFMTFDGDILRDLQRLLL